jgi:hypothetical protein
VLRIRTKHRLDISDKKLRKRNFAGASIFRKTGIPEETRRGLARNGEGGGAMLRRTQPKNTALLALVARIQGSAGPGDEQRTPPAWTRSGEEGAN